MNRTDNLVRVGIIGVGDMGSVHAKSLLAGKINRCVLTAVCDHNAEHLTPFPQAKAFTRGEDLIRSGLVDAVLIATPHYDHTVTGMDALRQGLHVLVEKPISVHKADCQRLIAAHTNKRQVFAAMFNQRAYPSYRKLHELIRNGELGEIRRVNWTITNWFRTEAYYASGGWRATWAGEGGGVLLNQSPHNLDLFQWFFGMPGRVRGYCQIGRYHDIEVEDDVTAYFEYPNGTTGVFITSTGEAPGTNRLEVAAENGRLVLENDVLVFTKNVMPMTQFSRTSDKGFARPATQEQRFEFPQHGVQHEIVIQNFVDAILDGTPLIAPAEEGIHSVELGNAILLSSLQKRAIDLPLDAAEFEDYLKNKLIPSSRFSKKVTKRPAAPSDFAQSFGR
jgi:predicted dehydrogenase